MCALARRYLAQRRAAYTKLKASAWRAEVLRKALARRLAAHAEAAHAAGICRRGAGRVLHEWYGVARQYTRLGAVPAGIRLGSLVGPTAGEIDQLRSHQVPWSVNCAALSFLSAAIRSLSAACSASSPQCTAVRRGSQSAPRAFRYTAESAHARRWPWAAMRRMRHAKQSPKAHGR